MKNRPKTARWIPALLLSLALTGSAIAEETISVSVDAIRPTQPAAGFAAAEATGAARFADVRDPAALATKLANEKPLRGVRGPGGAIYLTDGHHRALSAYRAARRVCAEQGSECRERARVRIQIDRDLSSASWDRFYDTLASGDDLYLPPDVRARVERGELNKAKVFMPAAGILPADLGGLRDDPMRSAIGELFYRRHVDGGHFRNYVEFLVGERLAKRKIPASDAHLADAIFGDAETVLALRCLARRSDAEWVEAQAELDRALLESGHADASAGEWKNPASAAACDLRASVERVIRLGEPAVSAGAADGAFAPLERAAPPCPP